MDAAEAATAETASAEVAKSVEGVRPTKVDERSPDVVRRVECDRIDRIVIVESDSVPGKAVVARRILLNDIDVYHYEHREKSNFPLLLRCQECRCDHALIPSDSSRYSFLKSSLLSNHLCSASCLLFCFLHSSASLITYEASSNVFPTLTCSFAACIWTRLIPR